MKIFFVFLRPASQYLLLANLYALLPSNAVLNLSFLTTSSFACQVDPEITSQISNFLLNVFICYSTKIVSVGMAHLKRAKIKRLKFKNEKEKYLGQR